MAAFKDKSFLSRKIHTMWNPTCYAAALPWTVPSCLFVTLFEFEFYIEAIQVFNKKFRRLIEDREKVFEPNDLYLL